MRCKASLSKVCIEFNGDKSVLIIFGKDTAPEHKLMLGPTEVTRKDGHPHMGIILSSSKECELSFIKDKIKKARNAFFAVQGLGNRRLPTTPKVASKLYWSISIPILSHGLEIIEITKPIMQSLEQAHGEMAKMMQGLPTQTANFTCLAPLGWISLESFIDKLKILFLWRLLALPYRCIYKQVAIIRVIHHLYPHEPGTPSYGPIHGMINAFHVISSAS